MLTAEIEQSRLCMSTALSKGLVSGSVDASLVEIDNSSLLSDGDFRIGPFAVLKPTSTSGVHRGAQANSESERSFESTASSAETTTLTAPANPLTIENLPAFPDDLLQWPDLFGLCDDLYGLTSNLPLACNLQQDTNFTSYSSGNEIGNAIWSASLESVPEIAEYNERSNTTPAEVFHSNTSATRLKAPDDVLSEASFLLDIFQNHVVPRLTVVPLGQKTPWNMLSLPAAIVTLGDMTILHSPGINHARQANLYSLLACAAYYVAMTPSQQLATSYPPGYWAQVASRSYHEAKGHLRISLSQETGGPTKAKFKEQLMAMFGMMECAVRHYISFVSIVFISNN